MNENIKIEITGLEKIERDLDKISGAVASGVEDAMNELKGLVELSVQNLDAIDTRVLLHSWSVVDLKTFLGGRVDIKSFSGHVDAREFVLGSNSGYSLIVEKGVSGRNYPGRPVVSNALDAFDSSDIVDKHIRKNLDEKLTGSK